MPVHLEIVEGPAKGRKIDLQIGKTVSIGRTERSMVVVPEDDSLSGQHVTVGLKNGAVLLCNLSKTNGTEVNGKRVDTHLLKPGETFKTGRTTFAVIGAPPSPHEAKLRVGGWGIQNIPTGWDVIEGSGLRHTASEPFRANMSVLEEPLPKDHTLKSYVELQMELGRTHISGSVFKGPVEAKIQGAEQAMALSMTAPVEGKGMAIQHQLYALHSGIVGVFTATALDSQSQLLREAMGAVLKGLSFFQS
ncbi:MAG TPA: FHA domain-containing protein [Bryobacteraceae bacterium]|jgi:pSer/pThr/pTyr-binding forkhead associated (FHA) protein